MRLKTEHIAERSNMPLALNVTLNSDGLLLSAYFGDTRRAFRRAVQDARELYGVPTRRHPDIAIAGSHPCDIEFWQAHKALYPAAMMVRPGGSILVVRPRAEGVTATHQDSLSYACDLDEKIVERYDSGATAAPDRPTVGVLTHAPDTLPLVA